MQEDILMNSKEIERYRVLEMVKKRQLTLADAAKRMRVGYRQAKRLHREYKKHGKAGLVSKKRGQPSNRATPKEVNDQATSLIIEHYTDFSPTLAMENLEKRHGIILSREKIRQLMIEAGIYRSRRKKKQGKIHQRRERRESFGELIQIDGSSHAWLENRAEKCTLLAGIDDATGFIVCARFEPSETTNGYFRLVEQELRRYGLPLAYYSDKYGVFRVNQGEAPRNKTQFKTALDRLRIELICAHSPQAKGRIERLFGTLQDRLVKEMRLRGISSIEEANLFLPFYLEEHNKQFGIAPITPIDAHRPLNHDLDLTRVLCKRAQRKVTKNLEINWDCRILQIQAPNQVNRLRGAQVEILETLDGEILIERNGELLDFKEFNPRPLQPPILDAKQLEVHKPAS